MEAEFWIKAWQEGRTAFHQSKYNEKLTKYFPSLMKAQGERAFVPLCGKTRDMVWLAQQGLLVFGVELFEPAVRDFFEENQLQSPEVTKDQHFTHYSSQNIKISVGDAFQYQAPLPFDLVYDRASLVALPPEMRAPYAKQICSLLKSGGRSLLITYEYDEREMQGPPFSISEKEVNMLFGYQCDIGLTESTKITPENPRFSQVPSLLEKVYILTKH